MRNDVFLELLFYPFFKDCIGAIDGTYITAWVPIKDHQRGVHNLQIPDGKYYLVDAGYGETNEESDSQYAYRLRDMIALDMWNANDNRRAR
ncbi:hypothetical protein AAC387_Pa06g0195 [Persea americana]